MAGGQSSDSSAHSCSCCLLYSSKQASSNNLQNALITEFRELLTAHGGYNFGSYVVGTDKKNAREDQPVFIPKPNLIARALNRILVIYQTNLIGVDFHVTFAPTTVIGLNEAQKHPKIEIFRANDHFASVIRRSE